MLSRSHSFRMVFRCSHMSPYQKFRFRDVLQTEMSLGEARVSGVASSTLEVRVQSTRL